MCGIKRQHIIEFSSADANSVSLWNVGSFFLRTEHDGRVVATALLLRIYKFSDLNLGQKTGCLCFCGFLQTHSANYDAVP
jgi:hypothetical protein